MKFSVFAVVTTFLASTALALPVANPSNGIQLDARSIDETWALLEKRAGGPGGTTTMTTSMATQTIPKPGVFQGIKTSLGNAAAKVKGFVMPKAKAPMDPTLVKASEITTSKGGSNWDPRNWGQNFKAWNKNRIEVKNQKANAKLLTQKEATKAKLDNDIKATEARLAAMREKSDGKATKLENLKEKIASDDTKFQGRTFAGKVEKKVNAAGKAATEKLNAAGAKIQSGATAIKNKILPAKKVTPQAPDNQEAVISNKMSTSDDNLF